MGVRVRWFVFAVLVGCGAPGPRGEMTPRDEPPTLSESSASAAGLGADPTGDTVEEAGTMRPRPEPFHPAEPPPPEGSDPDEPPRPLFPPKLHDGAACLQASDCASGVCEGHGCTDGTPGTCAPAERPCTRDRRPYCGCDGETFYSSGSCPGRRYARQGTCGDKVH